MIDAYRRVLRIDPDERAALNNLAGAYSALEQNDAAAELFPDHRGAADNVFWGRFLTGDEAGARAQAERMIAHDDVPGRWQGHPAGSPTSGATPTPSCSSWCGTRGSGSRR